MSTDLTFLTNEPGNSLRDRTRRRWSEKIDRLVYGLYGLKEEEIKLVEESTAK